MHQKVKENISKYKELFIKMCISVSVLLIILTFGSLLASLFSLRPQTVIFLLTIGYLSTNGVLRLYERVVNRYEDPLPIYVLDEVEKNQKELEMIKSMIANDDRINITKDEVEVMAKKEKYKEELQDE